MSSKKSKKASRKPRPVKAAKPPTPSKAEKKQGVKAQIAALFLAGGQFTVEELIAKTGGKPITVRTALSDLKSAKYAGPTGALVIVVRDGKYRVRPEDEVVLGEAMAKEEK